MGLKIEMGNGKVGMGKMKCFKNEKMEEKVRWEKNTKAG
jgi:hypothetical protein